MPQALNPVETSRAPANAAEAVLMRLRRNGVEYLFANAGTDFAPIIEGYAAGMSDGSMPASVSATDMALAALSPVAEGSVR